MSRSSLSKQMQLHHTREALYHVEIHPSPNRPSRWIDLPRRYTPRNRKDSHPETSTTFCIVRMFCHFISSLPSRQNHSRECQDEGSQGLRVKIDPTQCAIQSKNGRKTVRKTVEKQCENSHQRVSASWDGSGIRDRVRQCVNGCLKWPKQLPSNRVRADVPEVTDRPRGYRQTSDRDRGLACGSHRGGHPAEADGVSARAGGRLRVTRP